MLPNYQFLGSAYIKTSKEELKTALDSINYQIYKPKSTILVLDGKVTNEIVDARNNLKDVIRLK